MPRASRVGPLLLKQLLSGSSDYSMHVRTDKVYRHTWALKIHMSADTTHVNNSHAGASIGNVQNIMGVLYSCTTFLGMFNMMGVMPILGYERSVMYR